MGKYKAMLILPFLILVLIAWGNLDSGNESEQALIDECGELVDLARGFAEDGIYYRAAENIEKARKLGVGNDEELELLLLEYYLADEDYSSWTALINSRINDETASEAEIIQLLKYYSENRKADSALNVLKKALVQYPDSTELLDRYKKICYSYTFLKYGYEDVKPGSGGKIAVKKDGLWGYASAEGSSGNDFLYDDAVSYSGSYACVYSGGLAYVINSSMKKYSVCHDESVTGVLLCDSSGIVLKTNGGYVLADYEMNIISDEYDFIGASSGNLRAYCQNGGWGFMNTRGEPMLGGTYENIALGSRYEAFGLSAAFVKENGFYHMIDSSGNMIGEITFEDAYPFTDDGAAAVKIDGKWGFISKDGEIVIPCTYDDAYSFSSGLAAVKSKGKWGFINSDGEAVIPFEYDEVGSFCGNSAPVKIEGSWNYITLSYYSE